MDGLFLRINNINLLKVVHTYVCISKINTSMDHFQAVKLGFFHSYIVSIAFIVWPIQILHFQKQYWRTQKEQCLAAVPVITFWRVGNGIMVWYEPFSASCFSWQRPSCIWFTRTHSAWSLLSHCFFQGLLLWAMQLSRLSY